MKPYKGFRFYHARVLSMEPFDGTSKQLYEVSKIARGTVYYRPVYSNGQLGKPDCCELENFDKWMDSPAN